MRVQFPDAGNQLVGARGVGPTRLRVEVEAAVDERAAARAGVQYQVADGAGHGVEEAFDLHGAVAGMGPHLVVWGGVQRPPDACNDALTDCSHASSSRPAAAARCRRFISNSMRAESSANSALAASFSAFRRSSVVRSPTCRPSRV